MMEMIFYLPLLSIFTVVLYIYSILWLQPEKIRKQLMRQGIKGPKPTFFFGNMLDMKEINSSASVEVYGNTVSHEFKLYPCFDLWRKQYGSTFSFATGNIVTVYVTDTDLVKEITTSASLDLGRPSFIKKNWGALHGESVNSVNGQEWVHHRKVIAPEFFVEKVKGMVKLMVEPTTLLLQSWESKVKLEGGTADIRIDEDLKNLSADVISRACFGGKGNEIFKKMWDLQIAVSSQAKFAGIPGFRYIPNKSNRKIWKLGKEIRNQVLKIVYSHENEINAEGDSLLKTILQNNISIGSNSSTSFVVDNAKAIYFAGHETTASAVKWALLLLALHPQWQARVRDEVVEICHGMNPNFDMLRRMKMLNMVIQEVLRFYPASPFIAREVYQDIKLADYFLPKGTNIYLPVASLHQDLDIWGEDAKSFNPERFANGVSGACKLPHMYMGFGFGPRNCLGQSFAMSEMKVIISLLLRKFSFAVSPNYRHSVVHRLVLEPEFGINLLVKKL